MYSEPLTGRQTFRRLTVRERGNFPNRLRMWPVTEVTTDQDGIALTRRGDRRYHKWAEIQRAHIWNDEAYEGFGAYASSTMIRRTVEILTADRRKYAFDVSDLFPDFKDSHELLNVLRRHLAITESSIKRFNHALWMSLAVALLLLAIALKVLGMG